MAGIWVPAWLSPKLSKFSSLVSYGEAENPKGYPIQCHWVYWGHPWARNKEKVQILSSDQGPMDRWIKPGESRAALLRVREPRVTSQRVPSCTALPVCLGSIWSTNLWWADGHCFWVGWSRIWVTRVADQAEESMCYATGSPGFELLALVL